MGGYLGSKNAAEVLDNTLEFGPGGNRIHAHTVRRWLKKMGFDFDDVQKGLTSSLYQIK